MQQKISSAEQSLTDIHLYLEHNIEVNYYTAGVNQVHAQAFASLVVDSGTVANFIELAEKLVCSIELPFTVIEIIYNPQAMEVIQHIGELNAVVKLLKEQKEIVRSFIIECLFKHQHAEIMDLFMFNKFETITFGHEPAALQSYLYPQKLFEKFRFILNNVGPDKLLKTKNMNKKQDGGNGETTQLFVPGFVDKVQTSAKACSNTLNQIYYND